MPIETQTLRFEFDGKGGETETMTAEFTRTVRAGYAVLMGFRQKFDDDGQNIRTAEAAITRVTPSLDSVVVEAKLDFQPSNDKKWEGWLDALVIADVVDDGG